MASSARDKNKAKKVITITSKAEFDKHVNEAGGKHILVEFFATWCGPCAIIGPQVEQMAIDYEDCLLVLKVDVDDNEELAEQYDVNSMPAFVVIKDKITLEQFSGSKPERVQSSLERFCGKVEKEDRNGVKPGTSTKPTDKSPIKLLSMIKSVAPVNLKHDKPADKK